LKYFLILLFFTNILFAKQNYDERLERVSLQLHWKYQFEFAGFIAAKEKGFYKDAGLDVTLKEYEPGIDIIDEVTSGKVQYGIYNSSTLVEYLKGKPIVLVASFFKRAALILIVKPNIHSPRDLIGKKIMATSMADFKLNFKPYFDAYDVNISRLTMVPHTFHVKQFAEGKVDAMTAFISDQPYKLEKLGVKYKILDPSNENLFVLQEELFTSDQEVKEHPQRVEAFKQASIKGWQYALNHKAELIDIIHRKYNKKVPLDALKYEADAIEHLILPSAYDIGSINRSFLNKQIKIFTKEYHIKSGKNLDGYIFKPKINNQKIYFTSKELAYIKNHKKIKMCVNYELYPIDGIQNGKLTGEMADIFSIISSITSIDFIPIKSYSEEDLINNIKNKKCRLLTVMATFNKKFASLKPTTSFSTTSFALLSKLDRSFVDDPLLLKDKTLIVQKDSFKNYLKYLYPYLRIKVEYNKNKMVQDILHNKAYAIVTLDEQADYFIDKYGYGKLKINGFLAKDKPLQGSIGVQKDEPILYSIIEKAMMRIPKEKIESIRNSWRISRYQTTIDYSLAWKILLFMGIILLIMLYYHRKLKSFNKKLEKQIFEKTKELREINESLEATVQEKIDELIYKDEILTAQSKQAVMGEMISMIAHQWRQPLNTITLQISNIQLQEMMGNSVEKEKLLHTLDEISNSVIYLSNTIDDFKTYFHPDKEATSVVINELIMKAIGFIEPRIVRNKILIETDGELGLEVQVYANELIQVILNILNNAIDVYEENDCEKRHIIIDIIKKDGRMLLKITDFAGGVDKEIIKKIFEPYFSTKGKNGTGLGLYMSKMIIEKQFNGTISVMSVENMTTFTIDIPIRPY
jgi:signal transduction histidine kinase/ABC-type nitrate/sulfonate/bicarbonate transport system substrate-binding protein